MIVACTCSIMWSYSSGMPQSISTLPQAKASLIVYVFPFCIASCWHCSKLFSLKLSIIFILLCAVDPILVHHCWHFWKEEINPKNTTKPSACYWIGRFLSFCNSMYYQIECSWSKMPNNGIVWELGARYQLSALEGVEGHAEASGLD
jgi:hypothetical protein